MMMPGLLFIKDRVRPEWDSKQDMLSMGIAGYLGGEYYEDGADGRLVVQCADGVVKAIVNRPAAFAVIHDDLQYVSAAFRTIRIGVDFPSYPLRERDLVRREPTGEFDAVIGGNCDEWGDVLEHAGLDGKRVAVAVPSFRNASRIIEEIGKRCEAVRIAGADLPATAALYTVCPTVVHLGHCRKGYLHTMAMYHAGVPGRTLVEREATGGFPAGKMEDFKNFFVK